MSSKRPIPERPAATASVASDERLRKFVEHSIDVIALLSADAVIRYISPAVTRTTGYAVAEMVDHPAAEFVHPDDLVYCLSALQAAIAAPGAPQSLQFRVRHRSSGWVTIEGVGTSALGDPSIGGVIVNFRDVTERARADDELRHSERLYRSLLEDAPEAIIVADAAGRILIANQQACELTGYSQAELLALTIPDTYLPEDRALAMERLRGITTLSPFVGERRLRRKDGSCIDIGLSLKQLSDGRVQGVLQDITERKRTEDRLRWLTLAVEQSPVSVIITDTEGRIGYVNARFTEMSGYTAEEAIGQTPRLLKSGLTPAADYLALWDTVKGGRVWRGTLCNRRKDGTHYWHSASISPITNAAGKTTHFLAIQEDITERRALEDQFRQAQKLEAIGRLAGGGAHDFNNILTAIISYSDLVKDDLSPGHPALSDVDEIRRAGDRAAALTRQLLALSRQQVLEPRVLDLNELVLNLEKMLHRLIGEDINLITKLGTSLGAVKADPGQLEQVIMNLAVNARDAMPEGGDLVLETANADLDELYAAIHRPVVPGQYVLLAVSDSGTGMDEATQSHLFEPFFTTKERGKGTGLGLSTVYGIVKQSGGYVWVYSEPGHGATFKIYLPRVDEAADGLVAAESPGKPRRGTETILLAEDNAMVRESTRQTLMRYGYRVIEAINGADALQQAADHHGPIPLLITDVLMPEMSGRTLAERLHTARPGVRVLFMSGYTDDAALRRAIVESGAPYLQKPFSVEGLLRKVRDVLDRETA
ncbi:MAG TPA: PAS domain S-box protein [Gemmatimonadales bacterium]|nr:PAS domain S-box protein [Gemmatimonadales bacterium]